MNGDLSKLSLNTATLKHGSLEEVCELAAQAGYGGIGPWRDRVQEVGAPRAAQIIKDSGLACVSYARGGFMTANTPEGIKAAIEDNRRAIDEAATIGAHELIFVVGGLPACPAPGEAPSVPADSDEGRAGRDIVAARDRVQQRLAELAPYAADAGVRIDLEPLHPMFAADRAVIQTLSQALDYAAPFNPSVVGVVVDTYHLWWDPNLKEDIMRAGREGRIGVYHVSDWRLPIAHDDALLSRGYLGEGYIDFPAITTWMHNAGYKGMAECEIFNTEIWNSDSRQVLDRVAEGYRKLVRPYL